MKRSKIIFLVIMVIFILGMAFAAYHMNSITTPPWKKKKEIQQKQNQ